jgi:ribosomal protein L44E
MKNRTPEQAQKHRDYMKEYYRKNEKQRLKNSEKSNKRGLEKIPCTTCEKHITRTNMKRHVMLKHKDTIIAEVMVLKEE